MKGLILAAGDSDRIKQDLSVPSKCILKVAGKVLIQYSFELLASLKVDEYIVIVGQSGDAIKCIFGDNFYGIKITYALQSVPLGIANAVKTAVSEIVKDDFILCLGDELFINPDPMGILKYFYETEASCVCGITYGESANAIKQCYTLDIDNENNIITLQEKPETIAALLKGTGFCIFKNDMLRYLEETPMNTIRKQFELCDWIQTGINNGLKCKSYIFAEEEININSYSDYLDAVNRFG